MELETQISEAIAKNLPAQVGEVLRKRLEQADDDASMVSHLRKQLENAIASNKQLESKAAEQRSELSVHVLLKKREDDVAKREHNADVVELRVKLEAAQSNTQFAKDVAMGLVRNTEYRRSVFENGNVPVATPQVGGGSYVCNYPTSSSTTTTDELK